MTKATKIWMIIVSCIALIFAGVWLFCCLYHPKGIVHGGCCGGGSGGGTGSSQGSAVKSGTNVTTVISNPNITGAGNTIASINVRVSPDPTIGKSNEVMVYANTTIGGGGGVTVAVMDGATPVTSFTAQPAHVGFGVIPPGYADLISGVKNLTVKITQNGGGAWDNTPANIYPVATSAYYNGIFGASANPATNNLTVVIGDQNYFF